MLPDVEKLKAEGHGAIVHFPVRAPENQHSTNEILCQSVAFNFRKWTLNIDTVADVRAADIRTIQ